MLRSLKSSLGPFHLAIAFSAVALLLTSGPVQAGAKIIRTHVSKDTSRHSHGSGAATDNASKLVQGEASADQQSGTGESPVIVNNPREGREQSELKDQPSAPVPSSSAKSEEGPAKAEERTTPAAAEASPAAPKGEQAVAPKDGPATASEEKPAAKDEGVASKEQPAAAPESQPVKSAEPAKPPKEAAPAAKAQAARPASNKKAQAAKPRDKHPLAASQPDMDVTVCEAGCSNSKETQGVVYVQPTTASNAAKTSGELKPTSTSAPAAGQDPMKDMIVCLGGCYDTPKAYRSTLVAADAVVPAGQWTTTVVPLNAKSGTSGTGEWMRRIDSSRPSPESKQK